MEFKFLTFVPGVLSCFCCLEKINNSYQTKREAGMIPSLKAGAGPSRPLYPRTKHTLTANKLPDENFLLHRCHRVSMLLCEYSFCYCVRKWKFYQSEMMIECFIVKLKVPDAPKEHIYRKTEHSKSIQTYTCTKCRMYQLTCSTSSLKCQRRVYLSALEQQNCQVQISASEVKDTTLVHL